MHDEMENEIVVSDPRYGCPLVLGLDRDDELWDRVYTTTYRRIFRAGLVRKRKDEHGKWRVMSWAQKASIVADWVIWCMVPKSDRPESWPKCEAEFATRVGHPIHAIRVYVQRAGAERWIDRSPWKSATVIREMDQKLLEKAKAELDGPRGKVDAAVLWYRRQGLIDAGKRVTVNVGTQNTLNVNVTPEQMQKELAEMLRYARLSELEASRGTEVLADAVVVEAGGEPRRAGEVPVVEGRGARSGQ